MKAEDAVVVITTNQIAKIKDPSPLVEYVSGVLKERTKHHFLSEENKPKKLVLTFTLTKEGPSFRQVLHFKTATSRFETLSIDALGAPCWAEVDKDIMPAVSEVALAFILTNNPDVRDENGILFIDLGLLGDS